jgi:hypothetical protein
MTPRTPQGEVFWAFLSNSKHLGVPEDSKSPTLGVLGFTPTLGQSGVATIQITQGNTCPLLVNKTKPILTQFRQIIQSNKLDIVRAN